MSSLTHPFDACIDGCQVELSLDELIDIENGVGTVLDTDVSFILLLDDITGKVRDFGSVSECLDFVRAEAYEAECQAQALREQISFRSPQERYEDDFYADIPW